MESHSNQWDFSQITEYIYLGADMCCGSTHYDYLVGTMGITADIDLQEERFQAPSPLLEEFLWLPTADTHAPSPAQLMVGVATIEKLVQAKKKMFIHCRLGHGRAPTLVAAWFVSQGMTPERAVAEIEKHRPEIHLNEQQMEALKKFKVKNSKFKIAV
jgi:protein-tyrosine phosphatase